MKIYFSILICLTLYNCKSKVIDEDVYNISGKIAQNLDSISIRPFKEWNCVSYNNLTQWNRLKNDSSYWCTYQKLEDTVIVSIEKPEYFEKDFKSTFSYDTIQYRKFTFYALKENIFRLDYINLSGNRILVDTLLKTKDIFPANNPFIVLDSLTTLKDRLSIKYSNYYARFSNFVEFAPYKGHSLYYLTDSLIFHSKYLNGLNGMDSLEFKKIIKQGERISKNWVLTHHKEAECQQTK